MRIITVILGSLLTVSTFGQSLNLIPQPQKVKYQKGKLTLKSSTSISAGKGVSKDIAQLCAKSLKDATGWNIPIRKGGNISLIINKKSGIPEEGYELNISSNKINIIASTNKGIFYGFQTFRQLLPAESFSKTPVKNIKWTAPCVTITDAPRFGWRGVLVDVSRHFQTKEYMLKLLDAMSTCKLNVLHWHLTDDPGWRLEIKKFPKLTKGSKQFYTQEDVKEIVEYAKLRGIEVVPEIDVPGHSAAAAKAYPQLRCRVEGGGKTTKGNTYCTSEQFCYEFLDGVLKEVAQLFPSKYIHLGADEVGTGNWRTCPDCKKLMAKEKIKKMHDLETYFVQKVAKSVRKYKRTPITWDEAFSAHAPKDQVIMSWRGVEPGMKAAEAGHKVVFTPVSALYFDRTNSRSKHQKPGYSINTVNLQLPYFFEATSPLLSAKATDNILGAQGSIWGEKIRGGDHLLQMAMLRGCALAEATWSPRNKLNWNDFLKRLKKQRDRFDAMKMPYFWEPMSTPIRVANWTISEGPANKDALSWDITKYIKGNGLYEFTFHRQNGDGVFTVTEAKLLENNKKISTDSHSHTATIDPRSPNQFYHLRVDNYKKENRYKLTIATKTEKSGKGSGVVMLIPALPDEEYSNWAGPKSKSNGQKYKAPDIK